MSKALQMVVVCLLALAFALAGGSRSMLLAHSQGADSLVICSDEGVETIYLDADGKRSDSPMNCSHCPDCLDNSVPALPTATGANPQRAARRSHRQAGAQTAQRSSRHLRPEARGPPPANPGRHDTAPTVALPCAAPRQSPGKCHRNGQPLSEARQ
ncbi:MAG: DUF2946 family protein [Rhodobacter sp.]|nr:DUF2946 family protein [Rhodobacter sp.]